MTVTHERLSYLPGWTLFEVRRDWPGWMLVTLGTLGPELAIVGRLTNEKRELGHVINIDQ